MALAPVNHLRSFYSQICQKSQELKSKAIDLTRHLNQMGINPTTIAQTASVVQGLRLFADASSPHANQMSLGLITAGLLNPLAQLAGKRAIFLKKVALLSFASYAFQKGRLLTEFTTAFSCGWASIKAAQFLFRSEIEILKLQSRNLIASRLAKAIIFYLGISCFSSSAPLNTTGLGIGFTAASLHNRVAKLAGSNEIELKKASLFVLIAHTLAKSPDISYLSGGFFIGWSLIKAAEFLFESDR